MKEAISIFVVMCIIAAMTSCASNSKKHHAKKHGLVQRGCGGLNNLPKTRH